MNDLVASSVCWTIATSWRTSPPAPAGSVATSRSTIWAWRTMLVRLWAGPSCIARAISRRRSSWAPRSNRETAGGTPLGSAMTFGAVLAERCAQRHVAERGQRLDVHRERIAVAVEGAALALQDVDLRFHQGRPLGQQDELGVEVGRDRRVQAATRRRRGRRGGAELLDRGDPPRLVPGGFRPGLLDQQLDLARARPRARQLISHLPGELGQAGGRRRRRGDVGHRWFNGRLEDGIGPAQSSGIRIQPWRIA